MLKTGASADSGHSRNSAPVPVTATEGSEPDTDYAAAGAAAPRPKVAVGVATFRRNDLLSALLPVLLTQAEQAGAAGGVIVVDNSPEAAARELVTAHQGTADPTGERTSPPLRYVHEPRPGIAAARNAAVDAARGDGVRLLAFLDDDEHPEPGWLSALVAQQRRSGAAGVGGPVLPTFDRPPGAWVLGSGQFDPRGHRDGASIRAAATNNLLLDLHQLQLAGLRFDDSFGLTGGSDSMLTRAMTSIHGLRISWATDAVVSESIPRDRATRAWILRRQLRTGNDWTWVSLALARRRRRRYLTRASLAARGAVRAVRGLAGVATGLLTADVPRRARGECDVATACGVLGGVVGYRRSEYRRR